MKTIIIIFMLLAIPVVSFAQNKKDIQNYIDNGIAYGQKDQYSKAISEFNNVIKIDPNNADAYNNRGLANRHKGNFDQALSDYSKDIKVNPSRFDAYNN